MTQAATLPAVATTLICSLTAPALALDNGLAETPPMGWNTFNCWHGNYDAEMIKDVADAFVASGLKDVGYNYVNIDGGWNRAGGTWLPEESKFPAGIAPVADHVHEQGLMLGIYCDTAQGQEQEVAERFATWGCDFLKHDDWTTSLDNPTWETMRDALAATDRPILYSIHTGGNDGRPEVANMWRTSGDIGNTWESVMDCIGTYTDGGGAPGAWPDPDMLQVGQHIPDGSPVLNFDEQKTHFSLWCVTSSPLILGNDVRAMFDETRSIVLNTEAIAVNQDISFAELE
ncbi:MAG: glycoside hydrolase family 27 protein, partial [Phycisphaeraceae bacterium]